MNTDHEQRPGTCDVRPDQMAGRQLAVPSVTAQAGLGETYSQKEALAQGTLFPELNLPFHLMVNGAPVPATPLAQLQALCFVITELGLYLDTHPKDQEAFRMFQKYVKLEREAAERYEKEYGPLQQKNAAADDSYTWLGDPWPWNKQ